MGRRCQPSPQKIKNISISVMKWCILVVISTSKLFQFEVYAILVLFVPYFAFYDRLKTPIPT